MGRDVAVPRTADWIVQFEPCADPGEYVRRVGGEDRAESSSSLDDDVPRDDGNIGGGAPSSVGLLYELTHILFLTPSQHAGFLRH